MAVTPISAVKLTDYNDFDLDSFAFSAATTAADGFLVNMSGVADHKLLLLFQNTNASTTDRKVTIKKGNALQGVSDIEATVGAGKIATVVVESGRFVNASGDNKGKMLIIPAHAELKMAAVCLP